MKSLFGCTCFARPAYRPSWLGWLGQHSRQIAKKWERWQRIKMEVDDSHRVSTPNSSQAQRSFAGPPPRVGAALLVPYKANSAAARFQELPQGSRRLRQMALGQQTLPRQGKARDELPLTVKRCQFIT